MQNLGILAELHYARFDRTLADASPSTVRAAYTAALAKPLEQQNASFIRWVEQRHAQTWTGRDVEGDALEAVHAMELRKAITAARHARIPEDVKAARAAITKADALVNRARSMGVRSQRPALYGVAS